MWAVAQAGTTTTTVYGWQASTGAWTSYTSAPAGGVGANIIGGAVDPLTNLFYYVAYSGTTAYIFAFDTVAKTPVGSNYIATFSMPRAGNGDIAFDGSGNLYFVSKASPGAGLLGSIPASELPDTAPAGAAPMLETKTISQFASDSNAYNGIAFDNTGNLYLSQATPSSQMFRVDPASGQITATAALSTSSTIADLASCATAPSLELKKNLPDGRAAADQFALSITGGSVNQGNSATTSGSASGVQAAIAGPVPALVGSTYTFTETLAPGSGSTSLAPYNTGASCTDSVNADDTVTPSEIVVSGASASFTVTVPTGQTYGPAITCVFTNTASLPALSLTKTPSPATVSAPGQTITYTFVAKNTGNVPLSSVSVADTDLPGLSAVNCPTNALAVGASMTCTATYVTTQADVDKGSIPNTATVSGTAPLTTNAPPGSTPETVTAKASATVTAAQSPELTIVKSPTPSTVHAVRDLVTYTFTVTNTGNVTLGEVGVTDTQDAPAAALSSGPTCASIVTGSGACTTADGESVVSSMAPGDSATFTATYHATQTDLDHGTITDSAVASGTEPGGGSATSAPATATVTATQSPSITLEKTASTTEELTVGETVTYWFIATNTGNVTLHDVTIAEDQFTGAGSVSEISCPDDTTLAPGEEVTCSATYTVQQADVDAGRPITNTATVSGTPPSGPDATAASDAAVIPNAAAPEVGVVKSSSTESITHVGQVVPFSFLVTNTGNVTLRDVSVTDTVAAPGSQENLSAIQCPDTVLAPGDSTTCTADYTVSQADLDHGGVSDTATAAGNAPNGDSTTSKESPLTIPADQSPALSLVKSAAPATVDSTGDTVTYSFLIANTGNVTMSDIGIDETAFSGTGIVSTVNCPVVTLAPGASTICTATYTVTQQDVDAGAVTNTAVAYGTQPGTDANPDPAATTSNASSAVVQATQQPGIDVEKSTTTTAITHPGQVVPFSFLVTNTGNVSLTHVSVTDTVDPPGSQSNLSALDCPASELTAGDSMTCTAEYTVTQADLDHGGVSDAASTSGTPPTGDPVTSPESPVTVPADQSPSISLLKTANPSSGVIAGDTVTYTFQVTNDGNVTLHDISVQDGSFSGDRSKLSAVDCGDVTELAPGASATCTATYPVQQSDVDAGAITNSATAYGTPPPTQAHPDPTPVTADSSAVVQASNSPAIEVVKSSSTESITHVGQVVPYSFRVTNTGDVTLHDVSVEDTVQAPGSQRNLSAVDCPVKVLAPGDSTMCTAEYAVTQADLDHGGVSDAATATGTSPAGDPVTSPKSPVTVPADQNPALTIVKSVTPDTASAAGDTVTYSFHLTNTGNVTLHDIAVQETAFSGTGEMSAIDCPDNDPVSGPVHHLHRHVPPDTGRCGCWQGHQHRTGRRHPAQHPDQPAPAAGTVCTLGRDRDGAAAAEAEPDENRHTVDRGHDRPAGDLLVRGYEHRQRHPSRHLRARNRSQRYRSAVRDRLPDCHARAWRDHDLLGHLHGHAAGHRCGNHHQHGSRNRDQARPTADQTRSRHIPTNRARSCLRCRPEA